MPWKRCGLIYSPDAQPKREWARSHAQCPTPDRLSDSALRIYFGTRDADNRTRPTFVEVDPNRPEHIEYVHDRPVLELGELGCFDDAGVIPFCIVNVDDAKFLYYAGCNTSTSVPYRMSIGLAVSEDGGYSFRRLPFGDRFSTGRSTSPISARRRSSFATAPSGECGICRASAGGRSAAGPNRNTT